MLLVPLAVAVGLTALSTVLFVVVFGRIDPRHVGDYHRCLGEWHESELEQCGLGLLRVPQQPVNTYSNLAYLFAGVFVGVHADTPPSYVFAFTMLVLCAGSSLYHALSTKWAGLLDVVAIYVVYSALAVYALANLFGSPSWLTALAMGVLAAAAAWFLSKTQLNRSMRGVIAVFLGGAYVMTLIRMAMTGDWSPWPFVAASFGTFALGFLAWSLDLKRRFPLPRWGHGVWHVLTAAASGLIFHAVHLSA